MSSPDDYDNEDREQAPLFEDLDSPPAPRRPEGKRARNARRRGRTSRGSGRPVDEFASLTSFVEMWLAPTIDRRLSGAKGLAWCPSWWRHHEVSMRLYSLWRAWEAARVDSEDAMNRWWVQHADSHLGVILDGEAGPLYRCVGGHVDAPALTVVEVPDMWFGHGLDPEPATRRRHAYAPTSVGRPGDGRDGEEGKPPDVFASFVEWVEVWLAPTITRKLPGHGKGGTWCAQWWRHREAAVRLHAVWRAWETAVVTSGAALSSWWVHGLDPQLRVLLDGVNGPLYRCTPVTHTAAAALVTAAVPAGWFAHPLRESGCDPFGGFGPDFRAHRRGEGSGC